MIDKLIHFWNDRRVRLVLAILVVSFPLVWTLGYHYTPINDGWVQLYVIERGGNTVEDKLNKILSADIDSRFFRSIPYMIQGLFQDPNLIVLKLFMIVNFLMTFFGVYLLVGKLLTQRLHLQFLLSLIYMLFPFDGTAFWFGAFGVNLGLLFSVWSLYFIVVAIQKYSLSVLILGGAFGLVALLTYPGHIPIYFSILAVVFFRCASNFKMTLIFGGLLGFILFWGFVPLLAELFANEKRNANVASLDLRLIGKGYIQAFKTIFIRSPTEIAFVDFRYAAIGFSTSAIVTLLIFLGTDNSDPGGTTESIFKRLRLYKFFSDNIIGLFLICFGLFFAGYLPYAITDVRFGNERQLIYARVSFLFLIISTLWIFQRKYVIFSKPPRIFSSAVFFVFVGLFVQEKLKVAKSYHDQSQYVKNFLGKLPIIVPEVGDDQRLIVYFEDRQNMTGKSSMLFNRAQFPISYVYETGQKKINVTSLDDSKIRRTYGRAELLINNLEKIIIIDRSNDITLSYHSQNGFKPLTEIISKRGKTTIHISGLPGIDNVAANLDGLTDRQKWYIKQTRNN